MPRSILKLIRPRRSRIALLIVCSLLLAACASDLGDTRATSAADMAPSDDSGDAAPSPTTIAPAGREDAPGDDASADRDSNAGLADETGLAVPTALTPADLGRDIVFRATIDVEVDDVAAAGAEARQTIMALGGIVFGESTTTAGSPRTVLTFKIQPADFDTALAALSRIGDLVNQQITADDVTDRVVDLQSRITTAEASVERLRKLLDQAGDISILASLENQLLQRETLLEQLRGQLRTLQDQVALATITLSITEAPTVIPPAAIDVIAGLGTDAVDACPGSLELTVDSDSSATMCIELENIGESALTNIRVESGGLRLRLSDFTIVEGDPARLEPGERIRAVIDLDLVDGRVRRRDARIGLFIDVRVTADPVDAPTGTVGSETSVTLLATSDNPLPGFGDSLSAGASALALIGSLLLIVAGGGLPFVPVVLVIVLISWWSSRRPKDDQPEVEQADVDQLEK